MEGFAVGQATLEAAEPFAHDFWVPGHPYRENLVLLCGLPVAGRGERGAVDAALTRAFVLRSGRTRSELARARNHTTAGSTKISG
jgi:hypothetical protein